MGVVGQNHVVGGGGGGNNDDSGLGWAVGAGVQTKIPILGGLELSAQGGYARGRLGYISTDPGGLGDLTGPNADDTTEGWNIRAGIKGNFTEKVSASVSGSFTHVRADNTNFTVVSFDDDDDDDVSADLSYDFFAIAANVIWTPVPGLYMGPEFEYRHISFDGFNKVANALDESPNGPFSAGNQDDDVFGAMFRIQRSF